MRTAVLNFLSASARLLSLAQLFFCVACFCGAAHAAPKVYANSVGMEFILIPAGSFMMGSNATNETPRHFVTISKPFYLGKYEVTQGQWTAVMGNNPSRFKGRDNPVELVSWDDAQEFIRRLNAREGHNRYRLPTEAEWECAARAGSTGAYSFGDDADSFGRYEWYRDNSGGKTHPVGQKEANAWGLYDMHGNVHEWVRDWYGERYYSHSPGSDPTGPSSGSLRVVRGGSWGGSAEYCRSAGRGSLAPAARGGYVGLRLALSPE
jgi:formylglycine-generating enzyme required for sulfatase activity